MKRYIGIRQIENNTYEVNFRPFKKADRVFRRIESNSMQEASIRRAELITEFQRSIGLTKEDNIRLSEDFLKVWKDLHRGLISDNLPIKTINHYKNTFQRLFFDFKNSKFPNVHSFNQLSLPFFTEYKDYYCNNLNRSKGFRAELIFVKAIMRRIYRLGYCSAFFRQLLPPLPEKIYQ